MTVPTREVCHSLHAVVTADPLEGAQSTPPWPLPDPRLLRRLGASSADLERLAERPHAHLLHHTSSVDDAAASVVAARLEALSLAAAHDGMVVDMTVPLVVTHDAASTSLAVSGQWVALDLDGIDTIISHGLEKFGLPEIRCTDVVAGALPAALSVLSGLIHRLLTEWPENDPVGPATVTLHDVGRAVGDLERLDDLPQAGTTLGISYSSEDHLRVTFFEDPQELFR